MPLAVTDEASRRSRISRFLSAPERLALAKILALALATLGIVFLWDVAVFRSGFYLRYLEPDSSAGNFETVFHGVEKNRLHRPRHALVVGDSQIGEGFSAQTANQTGASAGWEFLNAGIGGASVRNWYYLLRDLDPDRSRFDVIVLPLRGYPDVDDGEVRADREIDIRWMIGRLRLTDIPEVTASFPNWKTRLTVLREQLFEGLVYRRDVREFLRNPKVRFRHLADCRAACVESEYMYPGRTEDLSGLWMDWATFTLHTPASMTAIAQYEMKLHSDFQTWSVRGVERDYRKQWLGRIIERYRGTRTRFLIVSLPYRPFPIPLSWPLDSASFIVEEEKNPAVTIADERLFQDLQRPEYFFDVFHMNHKGRELFSKQLAELVVQSFPGGAR